MKQTDTLTLSDADLTQTRGGYPSDPNSNVPEDPTGRPLFPDYRIPESKLAPYGKAVPGQTPPIYPFPTA